MVKSHLIFLRGLNHFKSGKAYKKDMDTQKKVIVQDFYEKDIISRVLPYKNKKNQAVNW